MDNLAQMMAEDSGNSFRAPTDDELKTVSELIQEQIRLEDAVEAQEEFLKELKENLAKVREFDLPNAVSAFGLSEIKMTDGSKVAIKEEVYAGITEENREGAFAWLESTNNDGIIKNEVKCPFGKGQDAEAKQLIDVLVAQGFSFTNSRTIHAQTLKAFVKKQLEDGRPVPLDLFSVHIKKLAKITKPKENK